MVFGEWSVPRSSLHAIQMHLGSFSKWSSSLSPSLYLCLCLSSPFPFANSKTLSFCCFWRSSWKSYGFYYSLLHLWRCRCSFLFFWTQPSVLKTWCSWFLWWVSHTELSNSCWSVIRSPSPPKTALIIFWFFPKNWRVAHFIESRFWVYLSWFRSIGLSSGR